MKVEALCNVFYGSTLYVCGDVFEIAYEDAPGLRGAVKVVKMRESEQKTEKPAAPEKSEPETEPVKKRTTRRTTKK